MSASYWAEFIVATLHILRVKLSKEFINVALCRERPVFNSEVTDLS